MPGFVLVSFLAVLIADQLSKRYALALPPPVPAAPRAYLSIHYVMNRRAFLVRMPRQLIMTIWGICVMLAPVLYHQLSSMTLLGAVGIGMLLGGITGNVVDLLQRRGIVDFIALGSWTVFNIADVAIIGGLLLTLLALV